MKALGAKQMLDVCPGAVAATTWCRAELALLRILLR